MTHLTNYGFLDPLSLKIGKVKCCLTEESVKARGSVKSRQWDRNPHHEVFLIKDGKAKLKNGRKNP